MNRIEGFMANNSKKALDTIDWIYVFIYRLILLIIPRPTNITSSHYYTPLYDSCLVKRRIEQLLDFVNYFGILYGVKLVSFKVHHLLHLSDCGKTFGQLDSFPAYRFEK